MMAKPSVQRLAFLNFGGIGDEILFSPVIRSVRDAFPEAHLTLILENRSRSVEALLPQLNEVIGVDIQSKSRITLFWELLGILRKGRYDAVISSGSSPFIAILLALSGVKITVGYQSSLLSRWLLSGAAPLNKQVYAGTMYYALAQTFLNLTHPQWVEPDNSHFPKLQPDADTLAQMDTLLHQLEGERPAKRVFIHPGVSRISVEKNILKAWPVAHWQQFLERLASANPDTRIYLLGGPDDQAVLTELEAFRTTLPNSLKERVVNLYGQTKNLRELAALIAQGDLLISVDSAPMHLAIGLKTPVVAIFSPTDPEKLVPKAPWIQTVFRADLGCRPCLWDKRSQSCDNPVCLDVSVDQVLEATNRLINSPSPVS